MPVKAIEHDRQKSKAASASHQRNLMAGTFLISTSTLNFSSSVRRGIGHYVFLGYETGDFCFGLFCFWICMAKLPLALVPIPLLNGGICYCLLYTSCWGGAHWLAR